MKRVITLTSCPITGEVTTKWLEGSKCIHSIKTETIQIAKNKIKRYRATGELPDIKNKPIRLQPTVETTVTTLAPVNYQYFHKRCQKPVYIADKENVMWNGKPEIVLILRDAAGKIYRIFQSLIARYLTEYLTPSLN